ncbi:MAG: hypothetical protein M3O70_26060 [Actinomycetota bacterium]|nr:hypothetical protein [Actinomycetota bacterium]
MALVDATDRSLKAMPPGMLEPAPRIDSDRLLRGDAHPDRHACLVEAQLPPEDLVEARVSLPVPGWTR